ncbi:hypothetical protein BACCAP_04065 [Pseudoflavonifractor capillosus ATCC 29799]|uniref:Uncharacterized protein n=1 Tax=Pseudoflavonifractor capillosus ATCC 29799 TaxID=411467 RepID=A6P0Q5_9FIRM|nr:hypothetical protein BACCAP_04065 [Pseudoflavonifractor capillosus ATCC 29799]
MDTVYHSPGENARGNSHKYANLPHNFLIKFVLIEYSSELYIEIIHYPGEYTA